jgi:hypothetical protein
MELAPPARRLAALLPAVLAAGLALAYQPGAAPAGSAAALQPASPASDTAVQPAATPADPPRPAAAEGTASSGDDAPCYRVLPLDEKRRTLACKNGDRFTIGLAADGKWYPETKVRAGLVPGYASPEAAGKALCKCS